jgi:hypothetical protein
VARSMIAAQTFVHYILGFGILAAAVLGLGLVFGPKVKYVVFKRARHARKKNEPENVRIVRVKNTPG